MGLPNCLRSCGIFRGEFPGAAGDTDHLRADADAAFVERFDGDFVAFAGLAKNVFFGHAAVFKNQFAGGRRANAELVFFFADGEAGEILFDQKCSDAFVSGRGIESGEEHEESGFFAVRDPELAAVENIVLPFKLGAWSAARKRRSPNRPRSAHRRRLCRRPSSEDSAFSAPRCPSAEAHC